MASIVKRGKSYSVVYYQGTGKKRQQVWESGLSYSTAKSRKAQVEHEQATNTITTVDSKDMTVSEFLYEFIEKYGLKKWRASTYDGNNGLLENYVHPYLGDKKLRSIKTKTVDDYYHFLETEAEPATNMGKPMRDHITAATIMTSIRYCGVVKSASCSGTRSILKSRASILTGQSIGYPRKT